jgi:hypothetical protein
MYILFRENRRLGLPPLIRLGLSASISRPTFFLFSPPVQPHFTILPSPLLVQSFTMTFSLRVPFFLLSIGLSAQRAKALPIPLALKLKTFDTFGASRGISFTELAALSIFATGKTSLTTSSILSTISSRTPPPSSSLAAIIWLVAGTYVSSVITEARATAVVRSLRRTSVIQPSFILHGAVPLTSVAVHPTGNALSRLSHLHAFSPLAAFGGTGRAGLVPRRIPARRGGLAYPMSASRTRWYQRRSGALPI